MCVFKPLLRAALAFVCLASWSGAALAWWNDEWPYRMAVAIDASPNGANLTETNNDVTVLLKLHTGNFEDFFLVNEDLSDIRFIGGDDNTPLKHHVESFDLINQLIYIWVKLPQVTGGINTERIWMYYGNAEAVSNQDAAGSYDADTALVYHFRAGEALPQDATAYGAHAASNDATVTDQSLIAAGLSLAAGNRLTVADMPSFNVTAQKGLTVSMWLKPASGQQRVRLLERTDGSSSLALELDGNSISARLQTLSGATYETPPASAISADTWQHLALVVSPQRLSILVGGNEVTFTTIELQPFVGSWVIGADPQADNGFVGEIDELRIDSVARNGDWIKAAVSSQGVASKLLKPQPAEQLGSGSGGANIFTVLLTSMGDSGWTIIMLLAVMAVLSWFVMIGKMLYINSVLKDNAGFLAAYTGLGNRDPALLDHEDTEEDKAMESSPITQAIFGKHDHFQSSPVYRLYHRGIQEVQGRIGKSVGASASGLSAQAVDAIKAALDAQMVREIQRLNAKMVLLTIAISGGPFLGLLGTVLGVMITFAAIALTGDVNIAAIAPGVAAALLTTVAGLTVAIPALFGYNYLTSRIKESIADMRVFSDEFITRLAEYHGREGG